MNKRIQELAVAAAPSNSSIPQSEWNIPKEFIENFAQLIIKECATIAGTFSVENKHIHPDLDPRDMPEANQVVYHSTCQAVAFEILEHFGEK